MILYAYITCKRCRYRKKKNALQSANIFGDDKIDRRGFGFYFEKSVKRIYPNAQLASHIIGFMEKIRMEMILGSMELKASTFGDITGKEGYTYEEERFKWKYNIDCRV